MRIKICGITQIEQGKAIADFGATALGFICVPTSPRYVSPNQLKMLIERLPNTVNQIGVFANASADLILQTVSQTHLTGVQLHGDESPEFCVFLKQCLPNIEIIKALRIKTTDALVESQAYFNCVDTLLLDAYHPSMLGGTGKTLDWDRLASFTPPIPWLLAGGLTPDNINEALGLISPDGIDLSSGVERSPGDKDLAKVKKLFQQLET
ncbi:phosphoribosylanthranilate isomerase [Aphanothece hegewaldii CCALA 016]|uniref:N-(5'-phosphoribosyl)anthranilate isomerase n=1 Tax=Aphanothece hegewaldii CCALA 016 TaxID=2107694 RepID=A0A2T1LX82_9CHRO|nr:phosphoribosylanthranilate isomerase [Aphanothece hegewaldii]PSF36804.1 phosphoribosylanthranilate isomerase [Aphanothece hegewaldii CCALA 016]